MDKQVTMTVLGVLALSFLVGLTAGCLGSLWGGEEADRMIGLYLTQMTTESIPNPSLPSALFNQFQYPALCFLLGLTLLGVFLIPAAVAVRGFFLAYTITSCARVFGAWKGTLFALAMLGPSALLTIPCLFILATYSGVSSLALLRNTLAKGRGGPLDPVFSKQTALRTGLCIPAITAAALLEAYICPMLLSAVIPTIT